MEMVYNLLKVAFKSAEETDCIYSVLRIPLQSRVNRWIGKFFHLKINKEPLNNGAFQCHKTIYSFQLQNTRWYSYK